MGWSFMSSMHSKSELIAHLTGPGAGPKLKTVAKCVKGSTLWVIHEYVETVGTVLAGKRVIACYLLGADQGWWGYKDMTESDGPTDISCPIAYLAMVPDPGGYATAWRERVKAHHEKLAQFNGMKVGTKVKLRAGLTIGGQPITEATIETVRPLRAKIGYHSVRLSRKHIDAIVQ